MKKHDFSGCELNANQLAVFRQKLEGIKGQLFSGAQGQQLSQHAQEMIKVENLVQEIDTAFSIMTNSGRQGADALHNSFDQVVSDAKYGGDDPHDY